MLGIYFSVTVYCLFRMEILRIYTDIGLTSWLITTPNFFFALVWISNYLLKYGYSNKVEWATIL